MTIKPTLQLLSAVLISIALFSCKAESPPAPSAAPPAVPGSLPQAAPAVPGSIPQAAPAVPAPPAASPLPTPVPLPLAARPDVEIPPETPGRGLAATPEAVAKLSGQGTGRKTAWLEEGFRCRAISTVRFRKCRFEPTDSGIRLRFNKKDVICEDVRFDANGDPKTLLDCRSSWLRIPKNNGLTVDKSGNIWAGSTSGWRWKDGEKYCCPGLWLEAPSSLKR